METKMASLQLNEGQQHKEFDTHLNTQFRQAIVEGLPQLALQIGELHDKCAAIEPDHSKLPEPDMKIMDFLAEAMPICQKAIGMLYLIECQIQRSSDAHLGNVLLGEKLQRSLGHAKELRVIIENLKTYLSQFHEDRSIQIKRMHKHPVCGLDALAEFDCRFLDLMKMQLVKAGHKIRFTLHKILNDNLDVLTCEHPKNGPSGAHHSSYHG